MSLYKNKKAKSEEVEEILGTPPGWIVRWGTTVTLLSLGIIVFVGWMIRVPEILEGEVIIRSESEPARVNLKNENTRFMVLVEEGDTVDAGHYLLLKGDDVNPDHIFQLEQGIDSLRVQTGIDLLAFSPIRSLELGEIKPVYEQFLQIFDEYKFALEEKSGDYRLKKLQTDIANLESSINIDRQQFKNRKSRLEATQNQVSNYQDLLVEGKITQEQYTAKIEEARDLENKVNEIAQNINRKKELLSGYKDQRYNIQQLSVKENKELILDLKNSIEVLYQRLRDWKGEHIITAKERGWVALAIGYVPKKQYVNRGRDILSVFPIKKGESKFIATVKLPVTGSGKIRQGQRALVKLKDYPAEEFGFIEAQVKSKPYYGETKDFLNLDLDLPDGLLTSKQEVLEYEYSMTGKTEIIVDDKRFLERLFEDFLNMIQ